MIDQNRVIIEKKLREKYPPESYRQNIKDSCQWCGVTFNENQEESEQRFWYRGNMCFTCNLKISAGVSNYTEEQLNDIFRGKLALKN